MLFFNLNFCFRYLSYNQLASIPTEAFHDLKNYSKHDDIAPYKEWRASYTSIVLCTMCNLHWQPSQSQDQLSVPLPVCHTVFITLAIYFVRINNIIWLLFYYPFHHLFAKNCFDIVKQNSSLVTPGIKRVHEIQTNISWFILYYCMWKIYEGSQYLF